MQFKFDNPKVEKIITDTKVLQKKVGLEIGKSIKKRLNHLEAADNFNEYLTRIGLGNPHPLSGNLDRCYSISVTANFRLVIEPESESLDMDSLKVCKNIIIKGVLEYHDGKNEWIIP